jgi:hypothetical protein
MFCECLFELAAHLPPTVSQLMLQALFIADLRNEIYTHLAMQALFIWSCPGCMPLVFSLVYSPTLLLPLQSFLFRVQVGSCLSHTLWLSMPHFSCYWTPSLLQAHWGRWNHACFLQLAYLFSVLVGECTSSPSLGAFHMTATVTSFLHSKVAGQGPPLLPSPSSFFIDSSCEGEPLPHSESSGCSVLFAACLFFFSYFFIIPFVFFFLFSLGRGQFVLGPMVICPREYCVLLICSHGGLPSMLGAGIWQCGSPPGFSI